VAKLESISHPLANSSVIEGETDLRMHQWEVAQIDFLDDLLYLPKHRQGKELAAILNECGKRERVAHAAAGVINSYLGSNSGKS
jgi:hypothetical protein